MTALRLVLPLLLLSGCAARTAPPTTPSGVTVEAPSVAPGMLVEAIRAGHPALYATAWTQASAEYAALSTSVYGTATAHLAAAVADPGWSALPGDGAAEDARPPAVILDLDETVLDNSPWQVRSMEDGTAYPTGWEAWCLEAQATAVPGVAGFLEAAEAAGVAIFYVSNRKAPVEEATRANLTALGLPLPDDGEDRVLLRGERPEWTSDKTTRREHVAATYRVVMLVGDNLGDFVEVEATPEARQAAVAEHGPWWGTRWFMLPNPIYGSWMPSLTGPVEADDDADAALLRGLDAAR